MSSTDRRSRVTEAPARWRARAAEALARRRVTLGFGFGVLVLGFARPSGATLVSGTLVACLGEAMRIWAAGHLVKSQEVTSSGPYRWFAHPLYVGSSVMGVGLAIASGSLVAAGLIGVYLSATIMAAVAREEAFLRQRFGDGYDRYREGDRPGRERESVRRFTLSRALANHEHRAVLGLAGAVLLLFLKATYNEMFWREGG